MKLLQIMVLVIALPYAPTSAKILADGAMRAEEHVVRGYYGARSWVYNQRIEAEIMRNGWE